MATIKLIRNKSQICWGSMISKAKQYNKFGFCSKNRYYTTFDSDAEATQALSKVSNTEYMLYKVHQLKLDKIKFYNKQAIYIKIPMSFLLIGLNQIGIFNFAVVSFTPTIIFCIGYYIMTTSIWGLIKNSNTVIHCYLNKDGQSVTIVKLSMLNSEKKFVEPIDKMMRIIFKRSDEPIMSLKNKSTGIEYNLQNIDYHEDLPLFNYLFKLPDTKKKNSSTATERHKPFN